ncbi:MAG: glutaminyl-peptide cyclotransferase [Chitinophagales bacterium]|nr:glutaminyl-peptide cyclotransferase [Chitinophagaceae bacterium]MCB9065104.1 glutaminyl-peptide cyclotransferase [Chitinophagales bacterium]
MTRVSLIIVLASILFISSCKETAEVPEQKTTTTKMTPTIPYRLVNQFPHSTDAFTEGLQFVDGVMYESTGQYGNSYLTKYNLESGNMIKKVDIEPKYFGEGMTVMGDKIYMLTYKERTGFVFDKATFKLLKTFPLTTEEGWGMTNDSTNLIYSDGTSYIHFIDPETFQKTKQIEVMDNYGPVTNINELEYINGHIYANQWNTNYILKIDPNTGKVLGQSDLSNVRRQAGLPPSGYEDVLNGIAYDKNKNRILITGKNWPKIFEVTLDN